MGTPNNFDLFRYNQWIVIARKSKQRYLFYSQSSCFHVPTSRLCLARTALLHWSIVVRFDSIFFFFFFSSDREPENPTLSRCFLHFVVHPRMRETHDSPDGVNFVRIFSSVHFLFQRFSRYNVTRRARNASCSRARDEYRRNLINCTCLNGRR